MKKKLLAALFTALMVVGTGTAALASELPSKAVSKPPVIKPLEDPPGF